MLSANMDQGAIDFQLEAAISKVYASVSNKKTCWTFKGVFETPLLYLMIYPKANWTRKPGHGVTPTESNSD